MPETAAIAPPAGHRAVQKGQFGGAAGEPAGSAGSCFGIRCAGRVSAGSARRDAVVVQQRGVGGQELRPRVDAELFDEPRPRLPVEPERLAPLAEGVVGADQQGLRGFVERLLGGGLGDPGQDLRRGADGDHRVGVAGKRFPALRDQGNDLRMRGQQREIGQRPAAPQPQCLTE